jgi:hypothetical protein
MAISKIATKGKQFYEALKDTEKALKIKDPDKRNNALQRAGEKATNADPEARAAKKISDQKYRDDFIAEKKARDLGFKVGGAVKAVKKFLSKKETNPYKSTVGDSYATRSKKQGEIEQFIRNSERSPKKKDEALKTLSERMKKERKETFDRRGMKAGGAVKKCKRDGIAVRGRTKGRMV